MPACVAFRSAAALLSASNSSDIRAPVSRFCPTTLYRIACLAFCPGNRGTHSCRDAVLVQREASCPVTMLSDLRFPETTSDNTGVLTERTPHEPEPVDRHPDRTPGAARTPPPQKGGLPGRTPVEGAPCPALRAVTDVAGV